MDTDLKLIGVELYSADLQRARAFYADVLGLPLTEQDPARFAQFAAGDAFLCVERKGLEDYPSEDRAVVFLEAPDLKSVVRRIGAERFARIDTKASPAWGVLRDPDGYNVLIIERAGSRP